MDRSNAWRKAHKKFRNKCRKKNYMKSRPAVRKNRPWTNEELYFVFEPGCWPDSALAISIGRSVQAIQQKRYLIKKEMTREQTA
jgi:hypothetical protein